MRNVSRRNFMKAAAVGAMGMAAMGVAGCSPSEKAGATDTAEPAASSATDWLGSAPDVDESALTETIDCDILVVGLGTAGHFAAMSAVESGAKVVAIEKGDVGGFGIRYQLGGINTQLQKTAPNEDGTVGIEIDRNAITEDFSRYSNYYNRADLIHLWYDHSAKALDLYIDLEREAGLNPHLINYSGNPEASWKAWTTGHEVKDSDTMKIYEPVEKYIIDGGGDLRFKTSLVKLVQDESGAVTGAYAQTEAGDYLKINAAKGVVVCTGGYAQNLDMMKALQPQTCDLYSWIAAPPTNVGDGIKACLWAGAVQDQNHSSMLFERTMVPPDALGGNESVGIAKEFLAGSQPWLSVDLEGKRFCNEAGPYDYRLHAVNNRPGHTYITLLDSDFTRHFTAYDTIGCSRTLPIANWNGTETEMGPDKIERRVKVLTEEGTYVQQADTWEELAEKLNIPADNLVATVERYNKMCEQGYDEDFGKDPYRLVPYVKPPFYGVRTTGRLLCTFDGIRINDKVQALKADGEPVDGLYCAGNDSGGFFEFTYPNLATGCAGGRSATLGYVAVKNALGEEL